MASQLTTYISECAVIFNAMFPKVPSWQDLSTVVGVEVLLARQCLYELARGRRGNLSAVEMQEKLSIQLPGREKAVRKVFRECECFEEVGRGRWQVGGVWPPEPPVIVIKTTATVVAGHGSPASSNPSE